MTDGLPSDLRNSLLAKIHIAKKQFDLDDSGYRDLLQELTGKCSAGKMTTEELNQVMQWFYDRGFKVGSGKKKLSPKSRDKRIKTQTDKIRALWIQLGKKGVVRNNSETALNRWIEKYWNVSHVDWLTYGQASKVIEALKAMAARAGVEV